MKVCIVTGTRPHHKHLCAKLVTAHQVVGIIHPLESRPSPAARLRLLLRRTKTHGCSLVAHHILGRIFHRANGPRYSETESASTWLNSLTEITYDRIPPCLIHAQCDVRQAGAHTLLRSLQPDVTVCLGGPVYPEAFITASPVMLNFHSGISPIYNGAASIQFAFAHGHPHLCGGTLMLMGARVDGGHILGHYFPEINSGDTPDSLFAKTVYGAPGMYERILAYIQSEGGRLKCIPQPAPLFYTRSFDLGWYHRATIARNIRSDLAARHVRAESVMEYWREPSEGAARRLYESTLHGLLWGCSGLET